MSDPIIADLCRELEKARITLIDTQTHLAHHAEANAALHCSTTVLYSPLHAKVTAAIQQIEHALQRTEAAATGRDETKAARAGAPRPRPVHARPPPGRRVRILRRTVEGQPQHAPWPGNRLRPVRGPDRRSGAGRPARPEGVAADASRGVPAVTREYSPQPGTERRGRR